MFYQLAPERILRDYTVAGHEICPPKYLRHGRSEEHTEIFNGWLFGLARFSRLMTKPTSPTEDLPSFQFFTTPATNQEKVAGFP